MTIRHITKILLMSLGMLLVIILIYGHFVGTHKFRVHFQNIYFSDLPQAFDGYRILQLSDLHSGTFRDGDEKYLDEVITMAQQQNCDIILFTGDLINRQSSELDGLAIYYSRLQAPDGVYSVLGNHDYCTYAHFKTSRERNNDLTRLIKYQNQFGWNLLRNQNVIIRRGNDSIALLGVENWSEEPFPQYGDLRKASSGVKNDAFSILLSHDPTHWRKQIVSNTNIQLTLSGHTHGGQFKVFGWSPCSWKYDDWTGTHVEGSQVLNISEGIGAFIPFRFGAWPEMNVITLRRE